MFRTVNITALLLFALIASAGCDDAKVVEPPADSPSDFPSERRIISLSPALTQMIVDLGLADQIVGVAPNDDAAPDDLPIAGTYVNPDMETIIKLQPTHVFTAKGKEGTPQALVDHASRGEFVLASFEHPKSFIEIVSVLVNGSDTSEIVNAKIGAATSVGGVLNMRADASELSAKLSDEFYAITLALTGKDWSTKVMPIVGLDPHYSSGGNTLIDELIYKARATNVFNQSAVDSPVVDKEMILKAKPDVILLILPNAKPLGPVDEDARLAMFRGLDVPAVKNNRIVLVNHPLCQLPSTSTGKILAEFARAIHPDQAAGIDRAMKKPDSYINLNDVKDKEKLGPLDLDTTTPGSEKIDEALNLDFSEPDDKSIEGLNLDLDFSADKEISELDLDFSEDQ